MSDEWNQYLPAAIGALQNVCGFVDVEVYAAIPSTNDRALEIAGSVDARLPVLVLAQLQTAGRGRGANRWWASHGALAFSLVLDISAYSLAPRHLPKLSLITAIAVSEALQATAGNLDVRWKWPNDVYISERKIAGILIEPIPGFRDRLVVGVGINVNNSLESAPQEIRSLATSLIDQTHCPVPLVSVLEAVVVQLTARYAQLGSGMLHLPDLWQHGCLLQRRTVEISSGNRVVRGVCLGIDADGALLVDTGSGIERMLAGAVTIQPQ